MRRSQHGPYGKRPFGALPRWRPPADNPPRRLHFGGAHPRRSASAGPAAMPRRSASSVRGHRGVRRRGHRGDRDDARGGGRQVPPGGERGERRQRRGAQIQRAAHNGMVRWGPGGIQCGSLSPYAARKTRRPAKGSLAGPGQLRAHVRGSRASADAAGRDAAAASSRSGGTTHSGPRGRRAPPADRRGPRRRATRGPPRAAGCTAGPRAPATPPPAHTAPASIRGRAAAGPPRPRPARLCRPRGGQSAGYGSQMSLGRARWRAATRRWCAYWCICTGRYVGHRSRRGRPHRRRGPA